MGDSDMITLYLADIYDFIEQIDGKSRTIEMFFDIYEQLEDGLVDKSEVELFRLAITCRLIDHVFMLIKEEHHLKTWNEMQTILISEYIHQVELLRCRKNLCIGLKHYIDNVEKLISFLGRSRGILIKQNDENIINSQPEPMD